MKTIVFSDCHGQPYLITNVLDRLSGNNRLIFSGDILDIGPDAVKCFEILRENNVELLWGNHDLAVVLGSHIWPQNIHDQDARDIIIRNKDLFKVSAYSGNVLITHAGLSQQFYEYHFNDEINTPEDISNKLNDMPLQDLWQDQSPIWYRPNKYHEPKTGLKQVVGHTPPGWILQSLPDIGENFISVDPYCKKGFNKNRFRYAIINDNNVKLYDSNFISDKL